MLILDDREWLAYDSAGGWSPHHPPRWLRVWRVGSGFVAVVTEQWVGDHGRGVMNAAEDFCEAVHERFPTARVFGHFVGAGVLDEFPPALIARRVAR